TRQVGPVQLLERADVSRSGTGHVGSRLRRLKGLEWGPQRQRLQVPYPAPAWMDSAGGRLESLAQNVVGVERGALPPVLGRGQTEDGKMQVGRVFRGVARRADEPDDLPFPDLVSFFESLGVPFEMGVVI